MTHQPPPCAPPRRRPHRPLDPRLRGAFTALVTPFTADGALDEAAFRRLVRWQILAGIDGLVPCGTTGESPTLTVDERERLIAATVEVARERASGGRVRVVAGTGTNDTAATILATRRAAELGADAALVVAPYYNRPDARMLEAHFRAVADEGISRSWSTTCPSRTGANVDADTFLRLAEHPRVVAVKEASGNLDQIARICRDRPRDVAVLAGDDAWTLPILALGGDGVVSVASNEIPGELVALCAAARAGDWEAARRDPRALAAAFPGQLPGRTEPGAGQGGAGADGPARHRCRPRAAAADRPGRPCRDGGGPSRARADRDRRRTDRIEPRVARGRRMTAPVGSVEAPPADSRTVSDVAGSSTTSRPGGRGRPNRTRPPPTAGECGPRSRPRSSPASSTGPRPTGRSARSGSAIAPPSRPGRTWPPATGGSSRVARPSAGARTSGPGWS